MAQTQEEKEQNGRDFEDLREIEAAFKLNVGNNLDKMLAIVTGNYKCPSLPGEPDKITKSIKDNDEYRARMRMSGRRDADYDERDYGDDRGRGVVRNHNGYQQQQQRGGDEFRPQYREASAQEYAPSPAMSKYAAIVNELERYRFADDDARRERQLSHIVNTIRTALQELTIRDVAYNTRKAFKDHVAGVTKIAGGLQVNFDFNGTKVNVAARGAFNGDETVCVYRKADKIMGSVVRVEEDGSQTDLSGNYGITLSK
jgi:hypothetical protein